MRVDKSLLVFVTVLFVGLGVTLALSDTASSSRRERTSRGGTGRAPSPAVRPLIAATSDPVASPVAEPAAVPLTAASLFARIRAARDEGDDATTTGLEEQLAEAVKRDPAAALRSLLEVVRSSRDDLEVDDALARIREDSALAELPDTARALAEIAATGDEAWKRSVAIQALSELPGPTPDLAAEIAAIGRRDPDRDVREAAAVALGDIAERVPGDVAASAAKGAVAGLAGETDGSVRAALLGSIRDTRDAAVAEGVLGALVRDADPGAREAAAEALGDVALAHRATTIAALAARFAEEPDEDVRRAILSSVVRAGRAGATATLEAMRPGGGALVPEIDDYLAGLRSGEDDPEKLVALKEAREAARWTARGD